MLSWNKKIRINDAEIIARLWPTLKAVTTIEPWAEVQIRYPYSMNVMTRIMYCTLSCTQRQKEVNGCVIGYSKNSRILCVKVFNEIHSAGLRILSPPPLPCHSLSFAGMFCTAVLCNAAVADSGSPRLFGISQWRDARMRPFYSPRLSIFSFLCPPACNIPHENRWTLLSKSVSIFQIF